VDGPAAAAARGAGLGGIAAPADGAIVGKKAVDDGPRHADAADAAAVRADVAVPLGAAEGAVHHVDGEALVLAERADRRSSDVGPFVVAHVVEEPRIDDFEAAAANPDRAAAIVHVLSAGVGIDEREVLHGEARVILVVAVRGRPDLLLVAGVHVEDARRSAAA